MSRVEKFMVGSSTLADGGFRDGEPGRSVLVDTVGLGLRRAEGLLDVSAAGIKGGEGSAVAGSVVKPRNSPGKLMAESLR